MFGNVNMKKFGLASVALLIFIFLSDMIIHGHLLASIYKETASLWRPEEAMGAYMVWMFAAQIIFAVVFALLFAKGYENKGIMEGLRFGVLMGIFSLGSTFVQYAVFPLPESLLCSWSLAGFIQSILAGMIIALIYRKPARR